MSLAELFSEAMDVPKEFLNRTPDFISDFIMQEIHNNKGVIGVHSNNVPRLHTLVREQERNAEFRDVLKVVSETILRLFPNNPPTETTNP